MKRNSLTIKGSSPELTVMQIALEIYLHQFDETIIREAHPTSAITKALHTYNRLRNIYQGSDTEYDLNYIPISVGKFKTTHERVV